MLYMMRHGRTDWNAARKLQGHTDVPLNEEGRQMARKAAQRYRDISIDICYCSPLVRAKETAEIVLSGRNIPILYDDRLIEMGFGEYEGVELDTLSEDAPANVLFHHPEQYVPGVGCESFQELYERTGSFLEQVVAPQLKAGKDILIVGHGAMNSSIVCQVKGISLERFWEAGIRNCELMKL